MGQASPPLPTQTASTSASPPETAPSDATQAEASALEPSQTYEYTIPVYNILTNALSVTVYRPADSLSPAVDLAEHGYLAKTPISPTVAVSFSTLTLFHRLRLRKPSLSFEAFTKVVCDSYSLPYRRYLRNIMGDTYEIFLRILRRVQDQVHMELGWVGPNYRVLNACSACCYMLVDEPPLKFSRLWCHDGNNSLKRMLPFNNRVAADIRTLDDSDYFLSCDYVDRFATEVRSRRTTCDDKDQPGDPTDGDAHPTTTGIDECVKNWKAAAKDEKKKMWSIFDETGIFASSCRHGFILWIEDMVRSGELAKYPLAMMDMALRILPRCSCSGYDINCAFDSTVKHSSLCSLATSTNHTFCVNAFHGYSHNFQCQLKNHPNVVEGTGLEDFEGMERIFSSSNQLASVTRYASPYRRRLLIETYFRQWDQDKYANLGTFILNNYKQALSILHVDGPALDDAKAKLGVTDTDIDKWETDQRLYFASLDEEPVYDVQRVAYVEHLQRLRDAENDVGRSKTFIFAQSSGFIEENPASRSASYSASAAATRRMETRRRAALERRDRIYMELAEIEAAMGIERRWQPGDREYLDAAQYIAERKYHQALYKVQQLVVQRLFELHKLNIAGTGYKLCTHISKSLQTRLKAIRNAIKAYNSTAAALHPPKDPLDWSRLSGLNFIEELVLLKGTKNDVSDLEWNRPVNRQIIKLRWRVARAQEEIQRCNVETCRLYTAILDEEDLYHAVLSRLKLANPILCAAVEDFVLRRRRVNLSLLDRVAQIFALPEYSGEKSSGVHVGHTVPPSLDEPLVVPSVIGGLEDGEC
ncbi:hypothetical protein K474DRAFT_1609657 [Panus rudis PR-1116 ss-1]|nr:hypothetical protein K474DRAFT_1609657 [Panus rudis PR-1116 ss-1]